MSNLNFQLNLKITEPNNQWRQFHQGKSNLTENHQY